MGLAPFDILNKILLEVYSMDYYLENGERITLGEKIASGGEGSVYEIDGKKVAKIYFDPQGRLPKMNAFINKGLYVKGICTPIELLYDKEKNFVGFTMQRAEGRSLQLSVFQPQLFKKLFPSWSKIELTKLALNILDKIEVLHGKDILVGDINPLNINVVNYNDVYLLDTDSFQVDNYPCPVGTVDFTAPEIQGVNYTGFIRTKEHEYYAIATLLFMIYLPGKHPYSRSGGGEKQENIINHDFVFPLGDEDTYATPKGQWEAIWYSLPFDIRKCFYDVFKKNKRYPISKWKKILNQYLFDLDANQYTRDIFPMTSEAITKNKTLNMNRRDITDKDVALRRIDTPLTNENPPSKIAVIELSTKACKLLIGRDPDIIKSNPFDFNMFIREGVKTSTGRGLDKNNVMDMNFFRQNVLPTIKKHIQTSKRCGVDCIYSVATAAYRTATNREEILACIKEEAGLNVRILKKEEEARATIDAFFFSSHDKLSLIKKKYIMVIDQGGGSTEVSLFKEGEYVNSYSINLGTEVLRTLLFKESTEQTTLRQALRMTDNLIKDRLEAFYKNMLANFENEEPIYTIAVGSAITESTGKKGNAKQHGTILSVDKIIEKINSIDEELKNNFIYASDLYHNVRHGGTYNDPIDRKIVMRIGLPMFVELMKRLGIQELTVSGTGLWYGIYSQNLYN